MSLSKLDSLLKKGGVEAIEYSTSKNYLDTGFPPLNEILTNDPTKGFPAGQIVMIAGPSGCGKTAILCEMMISAQKAGGFAGIFDMETQFAMDLAKKRGLEVDGDNFKRWIPDTFEECIATSITVAKAIRQNNLIPNEAPIVFGFDSIQSMTPQSKYENMMEKAIEKGEKTSMHDQYALSRATAEWFPVMQREYNKYGVTAIFLNQVRRKTDHMGREYFTYPGGDTPYFYSSTVLVLGASKLYEGTGLDRKLIKNEVTCLTEKSRNTVPQQKVKWDYLFDQTDKSAQFDIIGSYVAHLQRIGAIEIAGPRAGWKGKSVFVKDIVAEMRSLDHDEAMKELLDVHESFRGGVIKYPYPKKP